MYLQLYLYIITFFYRNNSTAGGTRWYHIWGMAYKKETFITSTNAQSNFH